MGAAAATESSTFVALYPSGCKSSDAILVIVLSLNLIFSPSRLLQLHKTSWSTGKLARIADPCIR